MGSSHIRVADPKPNSPTFMNAQKLTFDGYPKTTI
jgi:hypothetical protein